ncbi:MAG: heavy metal translocating P-type ATPase [Alphaproteobacteria bacterium]|nr:heavy metal translocating P-type ATPase [Alphaproteobacteria bacterium]
MSLSTGGWLAGSGALWALSAAPLLVATAPLLVGFVRQIRDDDGRLVAIVDLTAFGGALLTGHFAAAALGEVFILLGFLLNRKTRRRSEAHLHELFGEQVRTAWLVRDGLEIEVPVEDLEEGDIVSVVTGGILPVDGVVAQGAGRVDERALTGESQPADKGVGDRVFASTLLLEGALHVRCVRAGAESLSAQLHDILSNTCAYTDTLSTRGEALIQAGAGPTLAVSAVTLPLLGVNSAVAVSYSSFGYSMRLAAPLAVLNALSSASERGLLVKDGRALEQCALVDTVLFDKTGTLTREEPVVGRVHALSGWDEARLLACAAALEQHQNHPIARAILRAADERELQLPAIESKQLELGAGLRGQVEGDDVMVGSRRMLRATGMDWTPRLEQLEREAHDAGAALVWVSAGGEVLGAIELWPVIRPEAARVVEALHARGYQVAILSGDRQEPTRRVADALGIDQVFAEVLPQDKAAVVRELREGGHSVCFIGDGLNDAIALKEANVSISIKGATTVATDTASVVLMNGDLDGVTRLIDISAALHENIERGTRMTIGSGLLCIGGVYLLGMGVAGAIILYNTSIAAGVLNAVRPLDVPSS